MILLELVDTNSGRTVMEGLNRRPLYKELREKYGRIPKEAIKSGDWIIRPQEYGFQPQRYVDTFGNGVYSPTTYEEGYKAQYPEFETLNEAVEFLETRKIFGSVQRMAIYTQADGNKVRWTAGVVYTTKGAPPSALTEITSRPKRSRRGGTRWDTTRAALQFDLLCRAGELVNDA